MSLSTTPLRHTTVLGAVAGLHVLFGLGLLLGTALHRAGPARDAPIVARIIDPPRPTPREPPPPPPDYRAPEVPAPPENAMTITGPADGAITRPEPLARPADVAPVVPPTVPRVTPVQLSAAGRQQLVDACADRYPAASRRLGEEGAVHLLVLVAADGRVADARIESSSGYPRLDQASVDCVRAAGRAFVAQRADGVAVSAWQSMSYRWQLTAAAPR